MECEPGDLPCGWLLMVSVNGTTCQIRNSRVFSVSGPPIKVSPVWNHLLIKAFGTSVLGGGGPWPAGRKGSCKQHRRDNTRVLSGMHNHTAHWGILGCLERKNRAQNFGNSLVWMPFWPTYQQGSQKVKRRLTNIIFPQCYPNDLLSQSPVRLYCNTSCNA